MKDLRCLSVVAICVANCFCPAHAREKDPERIRVLKFLKAHIMGKTVRADETIEKADNGKSETVVSDTCAYGNLTETANGFQFDLTQVIGRTTYALGKDGKRIGSGHRTDVVAVFRYEVLERKSTGQLTGFDRVASCTDPKAYTIGQIYAVRLQLVERPGDCYLALAEATINYEDIDIEGQARPGAYEYQEKLLVKDGKLHKEERLSTSKVDPETLKRTRHGEPETKVWKEGKP